MAIDRLESRIELIKDQIDAGHFSVAARESALIIELAFREIYRRTLAIVDGRVRLTITSKEAEIGRGQKAAEEFGLGQMVGLFRSSKLLDVWSEASGKELRGIKMINLDEVVLVRDRLQHRDYQATKSESDLLFQAVQIILETFGLLSLETDGSEISNPVANQHSNGPVSNSRQRTASNYSATARQEAQRLAVQGRFTAELDRDAINRVLDLVPRKTDLVCFDIGCSDGLVTVDRFQDRDEFSCIIGIDRTDQLIEKARKASKDDRFTFSCIDVESLTLEEDLRLLLSSCGADGIDVVFSALTIHHLANPIKLLRTLRRFLKPGGCVVLRGSDDGLKAAFPDEEQRVERLIDATLSAPAVSDRLNGRKLYYQLYRAGYRAIEVMIKPTHTAGMTAEERIALFQQSFSYRRDYYQRALESSGPNPQIQKTLDVIDMLLEELELDFEQEDFFYLELDFVAIAQVGK